MHIEVVNFQGYEDTCTINYFDKKGDYLKTYILEKLEVELRVNLHGYYSAAIKSCDCTYYDELVKNGIKKIPKKHEIWQIEQALTDCVDWEEWEQSNNRDIDDFMSNDLN